MAFMVHPGALMAFNTVVQKLADEKVGAAKQYTDKHLHPLGIGETGALTGDYDVPLLGKVGVWHAATCKIPEAHQAIATNLTHLFDLSKQSAQAVGEAAETYAHTDIKHMQEMIELAQRIEDSTPVAPPVPEYHSGHQGAAAEDPSSKLKEPQAAEAIPDSVNDALGLLSWLSPSHLLFAGIELVTDVNPGEWAAEKLAGDWEAFDKAGDAMRNLGDFFESYADNIDKQKASMTPAHWSGTAAGAADNYFSNLAIAIQAQGAPLKALANEFNTVAAGVAQAVSGVASLLESLMDWLIGAALEAAAAAAASETIIGGLICGAAAAWSAYEAWSVWKKVGETVDTAISVANTFAGAVVGSMGALRGLGGHPLPNNAYDWSGDQR